MKKLLRKLLLLATFLYGAIRQSDSRERARIPLKKHPRILIVRPDFLGDLVLTTPVLQAIRNAIPGAHITMMVGPWSREIVAGHPALDDVLTCPFPGVRGNKEALKPLLLLQVARQLRRGNYDLAINLRLTSWWVSVLFYLAGIPLRIGCDSKLNTPYLTHTLLPRPDEHITVSSLRLISLALLASGYPPLTLPFTPEHYPLYFVPAKEDQLWAMRRLMAEGIDQKALLIAIHPGAGAEVKLWRSEGWAYCATKLSQYLGESEQVHFLLTGTLAELPILQAIAKATTAPTTILTGMTIGQLAAVLQRARLVLGVDSGPLHLATAVGVPTVRIYGPIDPRFFGPWGDQEQHVVLTSTHRCSTCATIPCGHLSFPPEEIAAHPCVKLVSEQEVLEAITSVLPFNEPYHHR